VCIIKTTSWTASETKHGVSYTVPCIQSSSGSISDGRRVRHHYNDNNYSIDIRAMKWVPHFREIYFHRTYSLRYYYLFIYIYKHSVNQWQIIHEMLKSFSTSSRLKIRVWFFGHVCFVRSAIQRVSPRGEYTRFQNVRLVHVSRASRKPNVECRCVSSCCEPTARERTPLSP